MFGFKGGIQVYSAFFLQALQLLHPDADYDVFLMHDTLEDQSASNLSFLPQTRFHFTGHIPSRLRSFAYAAKVLGNAIHKRPTLVLTTHLNFTIVAQRLNQLLNVPYWTVAHGIEAWDLQRSSLQKALKHAERILAVSHYTRDRLITEQRLDPQKIGVLPNTFDENRFFPSAKPSYLLDRYSLTVNQPVLLTICRLSKSEGYKGYDKVIGALPKICKRFPNLRYILAGKGDDSARIEELIHQLGLQDNVTLAGFIPEEELADHYNLCDLFAMPSKAEGFGIVYLEALACGKPVLAGNQDGATDALAQGKLGALVNPEDAHQISEICLQILEKKYSNPLIYHPRELRMNLVRMFGFERFKLNLENQLMGHQSYLNKSLNLTCAE